MKVSQKYIGLFAGGQVCNASYRRLSLSELKSLIAASYFFSSSNPPGPGELVGWGVRCGRIIIMPDGWASMKAAR